MSSYPPYDPLNPYSSPAESGGVGRRVRSDSLPTYVVAVMIIDLCLCVLRSVLVGFSVLGMVMLMQEGPGPANAKFEAVRASVPWEVATGIGIVVFGMVANVAILLRQRWGIIVGWFAVGATLASMAVGIWQATAMQLPQGVDEDAFRIGATIGVVFTTVFRLGLLAAYVGALLRFAAWFEPRTQAWPAH